MRRLVLTALGLVVVGGCAVQQASVSTAPGHLYVGTLTADPAVVSLDTGVRRNGTGTEVDDDIELAQTTLAATLLYQLQQQGFPAERLSPGQTPGPDDVVLAGHFDRISEGERASGGERPVVTGTLDVDAIRGGKAVTLATFAGESTAADVPGIAGGAAASRAALRTGGERARQLLIAGVQAESRRLANIFADEVKTYLAGRTFVTTKT